MENLVVRNAAELAEAVEAIVTGISEGLRAARNRAVPVAMPNAVQINGVLLIEVNAATETSSNTTPATTVEKTRTVPAHEVTNETTSLPTVVNEKQTPPSNSTEQARSGSDTVTTEREHEEL